MSDVKFIAILIFMLLIDFGLLSLKNSLVDIKNELKKLNTKNEVEHE